jgi:phosphopantothenate-cysteine ligase
MKTTAPIKVLITAGGTREDIDAVRGITNYATGKLGSLIAQRFLQGGHSVTYICGENAVQPPACDGLQVVEIRDVAALTMALETALRANAYDSVVHSMAVSDFAPHAVMTLDELTDAVANAPASERTAWVHDVRTGKSTTKISSSASHLALILRQQPKVIDTIKAIQPNTLLVGFKLLSGASEAEWAQAVQKLIDRSGCDYVLANDAQHITPTQHHAILFNKHGRVGAAKTKAEIAEMIYETIA